MTAAASCLYAPANRFAFSIPPLHPYQAPILIHHASAAFPPPDPLTHPQENPEPATASFLCLHPSPTSWTTRPTWTRSPGLRPRPLWAWVTRTRKATQTCNI